MVNGRDVNHLGSEGRVGSTVRLAASDEGYLQVVTPSVISFHLDSGLGHGWPLTSGTLASVMQTEA